MGEGNLALFRAEFNRSLRVESRPERLTSEAGAVVLREVLERLGLVDWLVGRLVDHRDPELITHPLSELLHTALLLLGQGWRDQDDADALRHDAVFRLAVSERRGIGPLQTRPHEDGTPLVKNPPVPDGLASQPTLSRLVGMLSLQKNREGLRGALLECAARRLHAMRGGHRFRYLTIDIDSLPIEVHGHQPGSEYNGHYHTRIFHPLIASIAETGDLIDAQLRPGNAHTAEGGVEFIGALLDAVERQLCQVAAVRMDAGFPEEKAPGAVRQESTSFRDSTLRLENQDERQRFLGGSRSGGNGGCPVRASRGVPRSEGRESKAAENKQRVHPLRSGMHPLGSNRKTARSSAVRWRH